MTAPVVLIQFRAGPPPSSFAPAIAAGRLRTIVQSALAPGDIAGAAGVIVGMHCDQIDLAARAEEFSVFFAKGGRLAYNGHLLRPFVAGLGTFRVLESQRLPDYQLVRLNPHPIFADIDPAGLVKRKGVAGFYGRGHVPPPEGALAVTGIGPQRLPIDWEWRLPSGGAIFMHAGNELWTIADHPETTALLSDRLVAWCEGRRA